MTSQPVKQPVYRAIHTTVTNYRILFLFLSLLISSFLFWKKWIVCICTLSSCVTSQSVKQPVYRAIHTTVTNYRILFLFLSLLISSFLSWKKWILCMCTSSSCVTSQPVKQPVYRAIHTVTNYRIFFLFLSLLISFFLFWKKMNRVYMYI